MCTIASMFQVALQMSQDSVECEPSLTSFFLKVDSRFRLFFLRPRRDSAEVAAAAAEGEEEETA